jgi:peptidyl-prolyl cis-trans isomerase C
MNGLSKASKWTAVLFCAALTLAACGKGGSVFQAKKPEAGDVAVAKVGNEIIWTSDVKREAVAQGLIGEGEPLDASSDQFRRTLDQVVDQKLLAAEASRQGLDKDPVVRRRLLAAHDKLLGDVLVESVVDQAVNDNAIHALYQEQQRLSHTAEEIHARQIIVATEADADAIKKLLGSGANFDALAMQRSTDAATRFNGGDLGYFMLDAMPEAYGAALKTAKVGETVGPFKVDNGFALVHVEDRRPEKPISLEEARPQIVRFLTYDEIRTLLNKLRAGTRVQLLISAPPAGGAPEPASAPPGSFSKGAPAPTEGGASVAAPDSAKPPAPSPAQARP